MKNNSIILIAASVTILITLIIIKAQTTNDFKSKSLDEKRNEILSEIDMTLKEAEESGKYKCCIEPPCKMCFLGNWIWEDGMCDCDTMIAQGKWDKVCPECKAGIKEGRCVSSKTSNGSCPILNESYQTTIFEGLR